MAEVGVIVMSTLSRFYIDLKKKKTSIVGCSMILCVLRGIRISPDELKQMQDGILCSSSIGYKRSCHKISIFLNFLSLFIYWLWTSRYGMTKFDCFVSLGNDQTLEWECLLHFLKRESCMYGEMVNNGNRWNHFGAVVKGQLVPSLCCIKQRISFIT